MSYLEPENYSAKLNSFVEKLNCEKPNILFDYISQDVVIDEYSRLNEYDKLRIKGMIGNKWKNIISKYEKNHVINGSINNLLHIEGYMNVNTELYNILGNRIFKNIIIVGCGYNPETAIELLNLQEKSSITCIDVSSDVINICNRYYSTYSIDFIQADGCLIDYQKFDLVFMVNGLSHKNKILQKIYLTINKESLILLRNPIYTGELLYEKVNANELEKYFVIESETKSSKLSNTYCLRKRDEC